MAKQIIEPRIKDLDGQAKYLTEWGPEEDDGTRAWACLKADIDGRYEIFSFSWVQPGANMYERLEFELVENPYEPKGDRILRITLGSQAVFSEENETTLEVHFPASKMFFRLLRQVAKRITK